VTLLESNETPGELFWGTRAVITGPSHAVPRYLSALFQSGTPASLSDVELLDRFAERLGGHDETAELAFAALLARHGPMVLRVCRSVLGNRHEVEDAFQATFLVLAVQAGSIRRRGSVASWLHGVALRVAASERSRAARRRRHEGLRAAITPFTTDVAGSDPMLDSEQTRVIQEEIGRLPEKYRAAVVLCYLEGLTHEMAAEHLGWPVGSVKSRLAWARDRLRIRLGRRGVAPAAVLSDRTGSSKDPEFAPSPCIVPTALADATMRGALSAGLGKTALAGIVSAEAIALMEGFVRSMTMAKLILVTAAVLFAGLATAGAGVLAYSPPRRNDPPLVIAPENQAPQPPTPAPAAVAPNAQNAAPAKDQGPLVIQVAVVDSEDRKLSGVDVLVTITYPRASESPKHAVERAVSDHDGRVRVKVAPERGGEMASHVTIWAHQPGRAIAVSSISLSSFPIQVRLSPPVTRMTLEQPMNRTITVLGADDRPIEGLRLVPRSLRRGNARSASPIPEEWRERLTVTTDANGKATLPYLTQRMEPLTVQVAGPGIAMHTLSLTDLPQKGTIRIGRSGRLVGIVRGESGQPLAGVSVVVWVRSSGTRPSGMLDRNNTPTEMIRFDTQPLTTSPQGAFQTPPTLLNGSTYRVAIRQDGFAPFVSEWVTLVGERATIPPIRLRSLRKLSGRVHDRQGQPVAGARAFLSAGGPSTITDAQGRFDLRDILPDRTIVLVEQPGFRLQGWPVDPSTQSDELRLTLVRTNEAPDRLMTALAEPIPADEARALADRVLEPYLQDVLEKGNDISKQPVLEVLSTFDPDRALDLFKKGVFEKELPKSYFRVTLAREMAEKDPAGAEALLEPISDPWVRATGLMAQARAIPASRREQKRRLLEKAVPLVRGLPNSNVKIGQIAAIAEAWLDFGEAERARPLLQEGLELFDAIPYIPRNNSFLTQLARLEPELALTRIRRIPEASRAQCFANAATQLAIDQPAAAERFFNLTDGPVRGIIYGTMLLCRRLARVDPPRARRVAASIPGPGERVCAWAFVALGLSEANQPGALEAIDQAIQGIDRLRQSGPDGEPELILTDTSVMYPTNPAAMILPIVERVAPQRLADVFWRAVALHPRVDVDREVLLQVSYIGFECTLLARYDREVASVLFEPMDSYLRSLVTAKDGVGFNSSMIEGKSCLDPRAAVALLEALPPAPDLGQSHPVNSARRHLAEALGQPPEKRWTSRWRHHTAQLPLGD
jgi:RNA polymerase sigma factor (sigma-70 family)